MSELRTEQGSLAGKYWFTRQGFWFQYKHKKGMITLFLQLFPKVGKPIVTIE